MVTFEKMADAAGLASKPLYSIGEVAKASGVPASTLYDERKAGRLKSFMPPGKKRGALVAPEWFDEWMREGMTCA